jgi:undecaprenyl-diphosphatase
VRPRDVLVLAALAFGVHLLLPQVGEIGRTVDNLSRTRWELLAPLLGLTALTYPAAAAALLGASDRPLGLGCTTAVALASSFTSRLAPSGLGGAGLQVVYLQHAGTARAAAVGQVTLNMVAGAVVHVLALLTVSLLVGRASLPGVGLPEHGPVLLGVLAALVVLGAALGARRAPVERQLARVGTAVARAAREFLLAVRDPRRALLLLGGSAGVTATYAAAFAVSLAACSVHLHPAAVAFVFLTGSAVAAAAPTPGGLGALEAALVAGLSTFSVPVNTAVSGVLLFRAATFWLPILPGFISYRFLRRRHAV